MNSFVPGQFITIAVGALVRRVGSHDVHYVEKVQPAMIINESFMCSDCDSINDKSIEVDYVVLFSGDQRCYHVSSDHIRHPDHVLDPSRLFPRLKG